jgi:hypothetical protein
MNNTTMTPPEWDQLLSGSTGLTKPDFHKLNVHTGRNDRLLHAVLCAYAKHHLNCEDIGWDELSDILHDAICNEIGHDEYCAWSNHMTHDPCDNL